MAVVSQHAMRRHPGGPFDPTTGIGSSYYAISHQQMLSPDKSKKSWSQRFKLNKSEKQQLLVYNEPEISVPSALSRSMKYAEPWLYGTIRGIPAPPINRQQMFTQMPEVAVVVCSCPEYLNGTKRDPKKATICKKCRGSRLPLTTMGGTMRLHSTAPIVHASRGSAGTVRLSTSSYTAKQRPSILNAEHDPYDMMRRSRLVSPELQPISSNQISYKTRNRAKSSSPSRSRGRSRRRTPSPNSSITTYSNGVRSRSVSRSNQKNCSESQWLTETEIIDCTTRRSILQSEFNAYELISNISHNEFSPLSDDNNDVGGGGGGEDYIQMHSKKYENILNPNFSITELAGQRIKLSNDRNSSVQQELENYEDVFNDDDGEDDGGVVMRQLENGKVDHNLPSRPPRRKLDELTSIATNECNNDNASSPINDFVLTTASLSHISSDMTTNLQINVIKSILKRPSSLSIISNSNELCDNDFINIKSKSLSLSSSSYNTNNKKLSKITSSIVASDNKIGIDSISNRIGNMLLAKNSNGLNNQQHINIASTTQQHHQQKEKRNSGSHFYLPMPQRKKVQFLDENEIIKDNQQQQDDHNNCCMENREQETSLTPSSTIMIVDNNNVTLSMVSPAMTSNSSNVADNILQQQQQQQQQKLQQRHHENINHDDDSGGGSENVSKDQSRTRTSLCTTTIGNGNNITANSTTNVANHNNLDHFTDMWNTITANGVVINDGGNKVGDERHENGSKNIDGDNVHDKMVEDNNLPFNKNCALRRTLSERRCINSLIVTDNVHFNDTTALRNKPSRQDSRYIFSEQHVSRSRPREPPPPPPPHSTTKSAQRNNSNNIHKTTPTRPPRQSSRKLSATNINQALTDNTLSDTKPSNGGVTLIIHNLNNANQLANSDTTAAINDDICDNFCEQRKRIQANNEAFQGSRIFGQQTSPSRKTIVKVAPLVISKESPAIHRLEIRNDDSGLSGDDYMQSNENSAKKTSIMINGDNCYSTINVTDDNAPLYQSSVVVSGIGISPAILKSNSNTVSINVTTPPVAIDKNCDNWRPLLLNNSSRSIIPIVENYSSQLNTSANDSINVISSPTYKSTTIQLLDRNSDEKCDVEKDVKQCDAIKEKVDNNDVSDCTSDIVNEANDIDLLLLLRNPVEAVKRNLVPHVCGKSMINDVIDKSCEIEHVPQIKSTTSEHKSLAEKLLQSDHSSFIGKLLEDPTLGHLAEGLDNELVAKLIENSLIRLKESRCSLDMSGTKDEQNMNKLIETTLQKVKEERVKLENNSYALKQQQLKQQQQVDHDKLMDDHEKHSMSSGNSYSSANYEPYDFDTNDLSDCYQSCSSELTIDDDSSGNMTRSKFYQMLVDATLSEIEIATNTDDDHHYESIRIHSDPIYEEINDVPPPLPLCPPPNDTDIIDKKLSSSTTKSMFEGASKYDILSYLVDAKERGIIPDDSYTYNFSNTSDIIIEEQQLNQQTNQMNSDKLSERNRQTSIDLTNNHNKRLSQLSSISTTSDESSLKSFSSTNTITTSISTPTTQTNTQSQQRKSSNSTDIERNDSGVGSETSKTSRSKYQTLTGSIVQKNSPIHLCEDCDGPVETQITDSGVMYAPLVCRKCAKKRAERKEIVTEMIETEEKYGRDLQIILEEFHQPMLVAGLLTQEQLSAIFLNSEELLENSQALADKMRDAFDIAIDQGDDDLLTVNIGKLMLDAAPMLHAFESYCIRQAAASLLLANMEKEKELLRIFLRVSQMENTVLRRMNLNSFLMVPVQRVTKYPLLLARLYKVTPIHLDGRDLLKQAQEKIELHLNHMNREAKDVPTKLWRRISSSSPSRRSSCEIDMINIKLRKMAIDLLEWHHDEVRFAVEGKLLFTQPNDNNWRKGRTIKLAPVNALLVTNGKPSSTYKVEKAVTEQLHFPRHTGIREAALLMVREKSGRYTLLREPLYLDKCIVCTEADWEDYFEVQEISTKDTFIFKAEDGTRTKLWYTQLQYHSQGMGAWRKRRNALANIMINGMMMRS